MNLLFVIGLPRSGTSLVHKLVHESTGRESPRYEDFGIDVTGLPEYAFRLNKTLKDNTSLAEDNDFSLYPDYKAYRYWLEEQLASKWVLKSPEHIAHLPELMEVFPEARFLWCLRQGSHTYESIKEYFKTTGLYWPYAPRKALKEALQIAKDHGNFDYIDVESIPEWQSKRDVSPRWKYEFDYIYDELRGVASRVSAEQFKERY